MALELSIRKLRPFKLSRFRQLFCNVGCGVCVINFFYRFQCIFLKPCRFIVSIMKMCIWTFDGLEVSWRELWPFDSSYFGGGFFVLWDVEVV